MEKDKSIVLKKRLNVTDLAGEKVMVDFEAGKYFLIKGTGNEIWDMLQDEITPEQIIEKLRKEYDVSTEECEKAVFDFLEKIQYLGFIE